MPSGGDVWARLDRELELLQQARRVAASFRSGPRPSVDQLIEALGEPGPLSEKPAVRALLAERDARPALTLIQGGRDAS